MLMVDDVKPIGVASASLPKMGVAVAAPVTIKWLFYYYFFANLHIL